VVVNCHDPVVDALHVCLTIDFVSAKRNVFCRNFMHLQIGYSKKHLSLFCLIAQSNITFIDLRTVNFLRVTCMFSGFARGFVCSFGSRLALLYAGGAEVLTYHDYTYTVTVCNVLRYELLITDQRTADQGFFSASSV
jgi:hypothetical protein